MWTLRRVDHLLAAGVLSLLPMVATAQTAEPTMTVQGPPPPAPQRVLVQDDLLLHLEVFLNGAPLYLVSAFTLRPDGRLVSSRSELEEIGLAIPPESAAQLEIPLDEIPGLTFSYEAPTQALRLTAASEALQPIRIGEHRPDIPDPVAPPVGVVLNYSLYASAEDGRGALTFDGLSAAFETRLFGRFGRFDNDAVARVGGRATSFIRLDSRYVREDVDHLTVFQAGDFISGGFAWTRPIRMAGVQYRRRFDLRPDLVTLPLPQFAGTAAAPSTVDLYINSVRALNAEVPQGPFLIPRPPVVYGAGSARIVVRDALGRETVTRSAFYTSPELLAPGLTDFSAELGLARRNFAVASFDYDERLAASASWRRGLSPGLTIQAHGEAVGDLVQGGLGTVFTLGRVGLVYAAGAVSRTGAGSGGLVDLGIESRWPAFTVSLRSLRTFGAYEDLASWTAATTPDLPAGRRVFGQPRELDQALISAPLPWRGGAVGASYVRSERYDDRSRVASLSFSQDIGRVSLFASAFRDFEQAGSTGVFVGLSLPLGRGATGTAGVSHSRGDIAAYVEAGRQGGHAPGQFGWRLRAASGERQEGEAVLRYATRFAQFEAGAARSGKENAAHVLVEGALAVVGGDLHLTQRIDQSFALVDAGAPDVTVLHENRPVGRTGAKGRLLVPNLTPLVANRIAIDPTDLPIDAQVATTATIVTPYDRVGAWVDFEVNTDARSALVAFVDEAGEPIELGSSVVVEGQAETYVVGYDGQAWLEELRAHNVAEITTPDRARCRASFAYQASTGSQVRLEGVRCRAVEQAR